MGSGIRPERRHSRSRRHRRSQRRIEGRALLTIALLLAVSALVALSIVAWNLSPMSFTAYPAAPAVDAPELPKAPDLSPKRQVFRHSVVLGGVYAPDEVESAMSSDHVVAAHYSPVNPRELRVETLPEDRLVYMSYRLGDEVFWTKRKVRLRQGETILTDGVTSIRARCGNCIAFAPMEPTADDEPGEMEFDALADEPDVIPSRVPLGSEIFLGPPAGIPFEVLLGDFSSSFTPNGSAGWVPIGFPVIGYSMDLPDMELPEAPPETELLPLADSLPPFGGSGPPQNPNDPGRPGNPGGPEGPGNPGDPGDHGDPGNPDYPIFPPEVEAVPAPEPATLLLVGGGLATLLARRRRRSTPRDERLL